MNRSQLKEKFEVQTELSSIEKKLAVRIYEQRKYLQRLRKLKPEKGYCLEILLKDTILECE